MGDLNFCSSWTVENELIPPEFVDVWSAVCSDDGFTVDPELNEMRRREVEGRKRVRFDRILVRSAVARPLKVQLVGTQRIRGVKPELFPSDHFGVMGRLNIDRSTPDLADEAR